MNKIPYNFEMSDRMSLMLNPYVSEYLNCVLKPTPLLELIDTNRYASSLGSSLDVLPLYQYPGLFTGEIIANQGTLVENPEIISPLLPLILASSNSSCITESIALNEIMELLQYTTIPPQAQTYEDPTLKAVQAYALQLQFPAAQRKTAFPRPPIVCECVVCNNKFISQTLYNDHMAGEKHAQRVRALQLTKKALETGNICTTISNTTNMAALYCDPCQVYVNSPLQYEAHIKGTKHLKNAQGLRSKQETSPGLENGTQAVSTLRLEYTQTKPIIVIAGNNDAQAKSTVVQARQTKCQACGIFVNSEKQWEQHISSKKHKFKVSTLSVLPALPIKKSKQATTLTTQAIALMSGNICSLNSLVTYKIPKIS